MHSIVQRAPNTGYSTQSTQGKIVSIIPLHPMKDASLDCHHVMFPPLIAMSRSTVTAMLAVRVDKPVAGAPDA